MKKIMVVIIGILLLLPLVIAKGGGGSAPRVKTCDEDMWRCDAWSECSSDGMRIRSCYISYECDTADTPSPETEGTCEYVSELLDSLKCARLDTMRERILCRVNLERYQLIKELRVEYLPEECRSHEDVSNREECVELYGKTQKCWMEEGATTQTKCLREVLNLQTIQSQKDSCNSDQSCMRDLQKRVHTLAKFRIYELEDRAETMLEKGLVDKELVIDVVTALEEQKLAFNEAVNKEERKVVLEEVRSIWKQFIQDARDAQ